jgi:hypothetical protein
MDTGSIAALVLVALAMVTVTRILKAAGDNPDKTQKVADYLRDFWKKQ